MATNPRLPLFTVDLELRKAGPIRLRTKYKERKLLTARHTLKLPFLPFVGLILTFNLRRDRDYAHLRVRCVEWCVRRERFACVVDDISNSLDSHVLWEVRDEPHDEKQFAELEAMLQKLGFATARDEPGMLWTLYKTSSGYEFAEAPYTTPGSWRGQHSGLP